MLVNHECNQLNEAGRICAKELFSEFESKMTDRESYLRFAQDQFGAQWFDYRFEVMTRLGNDYYDEAFEFFLGGWLQEIESHCVWRKVGDVTISLDRRGHLESDGPIIYFCNAHKPGDAVEMPLVANPENFTCCYCVNRVGEDYICRELATYIGQRLIVPF